MCTTQVCEVDCANQAIEQVRYAVGELVQLSGSWFTLILLQFGMRRDSIFTYENWTPEDISTAEGGQKILFSIEGDDFAVQVGMDDDQRLAEVVIGSKDEAGSFRGLVCFSWEDSSLSGHTGVSKVIYL